ncbi:unnamed protein product [Prunus brigantina]
MESFPSVMSPTYAGRRRASPPLQTSCSPEHELNGVLSKRHVPDIRSHATSLTSTEDKLPLEYKLLRVFSSIMSRHAHTGDEPSLHYRQATLQVQTQWNLFQVICLRTYTYKIQ